MQQRSSTIILARVSSKSQEDEGYSLDSQLKLLRGYCENKRLAVVKEFKIAETASKQERRKVFHELLVFIAKNKVYHFVVEKTDRLTRNYRDAIRIDDWLEGDGNRMLHMVKENFQLHKDSRSDAKLMFNIYLAFAKKQVDTLREEAMKGWAEKLAQGWIPCVPPPGYMTVTEGGKRIHVPNPDTVLLVRRAFELYLTPEHHIASVANEMTAMGLCTRKGKPLCKSQVHDMLSNPFYIGINRFNGKEYPGAQEPIISKELFDKVQDKLGSGRSGKGYRKHRPLFKGMLRCGYCLGTVTWQLQKGRWYGCCQRNLPECRGHRLLRQDKLEETIRYCIEAIDDAGGTILKRVQKALEVIRPEYVGDYREKVTKSILQEISRLRRMDTTLYEDKLSGDISANQYEDKHAELSERMRSAQERISRILEIQPEQSDTSDARADSPNQLVRLYSGATHVQKRTILGSIFTSMTAFGQQVTLARQP